MLGLFFWAGQLAARREADFQIASLNQSIEAHTLALRGAAAKYNYLPFAASQHPDVIAALLTPENLSLMQKANNYLEDLNRRAGSEALYVMNSKGITQASSNWSTPQSFVNQDYANRPYFIDAIEGRSGQFYGVGKTTGEPGLFMSAPVHRAGAVIGAVAVKVSLRTIQETWSSARDPIMLADERGIFFLGSTPTWIYQTKRALSNEDLAWIRRHEVYGPRQSFEATPWSLEHSEGQRGYLLRTNIHGDARSFLAVDESLPELGWASYWQACSCWPDDAR